MPEPITATSTFTRITEDRTRWRVGVEAWPAADGWHGRLVFAPEGWRGSTREGPDAIRGTSREDVVCCAYEIPSSHLRAVLHSLG